MRSRNVSPGFDMILTMISSESTRVPPVTAERSPPDSRMTGADSPVIADSSTEATPSTTSPSPGMNSPAATFTRSPARSLEPATSSIPPPTFMRFAVVSERALRSVSACALPRPSAIASAKLAKRTVNHSQSVICSSKPKPERCSNVVAHQVIGGDHRADFDDQHHGILHQRARIELDEGVAHRSADDCPRSKAIFLFLVCSWWPQKTFPACISRCSRIGPRLSAGKNVSALTIKMTDTSRNVKSGVVTGKCARGFRHDLLSRQIAGHREHRDHHEEAPEEHVESAADVVPGRVSVQPCEGRAVVAGLRRVGIQNLRQAVRPRIRDGRRAKRRDDRDRR